MAKPHMKKTRSLQKTKAVYGRLFILPWVIGFILFFLIPLVQSIGYSFSEVVMEDKLVATFNGLANYTHVWSKSLDFRTDLKDSLVEFAYALPIILFLSLALGVVLNQKFRGRLIARAVFFLPVIIASGVVIRIMNQDILASQIQSADTSASFTYGSFNIIYILNYMGLPEPIIEPIVKYLQEIFNLIWRCGVQIILFLAGLQAIPGSLYEVSKVEGATAWESFWFITLPMLSNITLLVTVYTVIDMFTSPTNKIMDRIYSLMQNQNYDTSATLMWSFFAIICVITGAIVLLLNHLFQKYREE